MIDPPAAQWPGLIHDVPAGTLFGESQKTWRQRTRQELGLSTTKPILATGHQTLLWHPGILAKYLIVDAVASANNWATANLIVDQHAGSFGEFAVPVRDTHGTLSTQTLVLTRSRPDVPMASHEAFTPLAMPRHWRPALPCVEQGVQRIVDAVGRHHAAPNAAIQMARALDDLMSPWATCPPGVTSCDLLSTSLAQRFMREMTHDPHHMARLYNQAVRAIPEAGVRPLYIGREYVELPLWRLREDGSRMRAYDSDVEWALREPDTAPRLMPRALFMTALVRLGMCDLFVHGTGGANYDRTMERWIRAWLDVEVGRVAVTSATLRLPFDMQSPPDIDRFDALQQYRRAWHDPQAVASGDRAPGPMKRQWLKRIKTLAYGSAQRRSAFYEMHDELERLRQKHKQAIEQRREQLQRVERYLHEAPIAQRRTWPFPLYPDAMLDALNRRVRDHAATARPAGAVD